MNQAANRWATNIFERDAYALLLIPDQDEADVPWVIPWFLNSQLSVYDTW